MGDLHIDAFLPPEMAIRAESVGVRKTESPIAQTAILSVLAGAYIALGAAFATTVSAGSVDLPYGIGRLLAGLVFCLGLILVVVGGAELFTGNNMIVMAWASGKVTGRSLIKNWTIVYIGNFIGAVGTAALVFVGRQYAFGGGAVGETALRIAVSKVQLGLIQAVALGILCNALVCMAVWLTLSARSTTDRILSVIFPITAFVAAGFEHSVANMYFVPYALLIKQFDPAFAAASGVDLGGLTWNAFLWANLVPVSIGNVIGGGVLVAAIYWTVYLRGRARP